MSDSVTEELPPRKRASEDQNGPANSQHDDDSVTEPLLVNKRARVSATASTVIGTLSQQTDDDESDTVPLPAVDDDDATELLTAEVRPTDTVVPPRERPSSATCHFIACESEPATWDSGVTHRSFFVNPLTESDPIEHALIGTYTVDLQFVKFSIAPFLQRAMSVTLLHGLKDERQHQRCVRRMAHILPHARVHKPYAHIAHVFGEDVEGLHHSKFFFLTWRNTLRVVISTANVGDVNSTSNQAWMQDFPRSSVPTTSARGLDFRDQLLRYLDSVQLDRSEWELLLQAHNFDAVSVWLVCSVPGRHRHDDIDRWGHMRMRTLLGRMPKAQLTRPALMAQHTSLGGRLNDSWLHEFVTSMTACLSAASNNNNKSSSGGKTAVARAASASSMHRDTLQRLRMVWPTAAFVRDSVYGWGGGGAICGNSKNFVANVNLKARLFKYAPQMPARRNLTPHLKSYAVYDAEHRPVDDALPLQYYLMTSANVSRGAWGDLQKDAEQFQIGNYEMGVLFLPEAGRPVRGAQVGAESAAAIDVPLIVDPLKLEPIRFETVAERANEDEWPWAWDMQFSGLDRTGSVNTPRDSTGERGGGGRGGGGRGRGRALEQR